jgi:predicted KAP-like P-loop ATPase
MSKKLILVTRLSDRDGGNVIGKFSIEMEDDKKLEDVFKLVAEEFANSSEGKTLLKNTDGNITVGDALEYVPIELWNKHGVFMFKLTSDNIEVYIDDNIAYSDHL